MSTMLTTPERMAKMLAEALHYGFLYGEEPYIVHLQDVRDTVDKYHSAQGFSFEDMFNLRLAAWLHDTIEDCGETEESLAKEFGPKVAHLVSLVSDGPGKNRKERKAVLYKNIQGNKLAIYLKLIDRLCNIRAGGSRVIMYAGEHTAFKEALYEEGLFEDVWAAMDAAFLVNQVEEVLETLVYQRDLHSINDSYTNYWQKRVTTIQKVLEVLKESGK